MNNLRIKVVEIEVNSRCNRRCEYCPVSIFPPADVPEFMCDEIFNHILSELVRTKFQGKISYHLYSEPLLRDDLEILVTRVRKNLPDVYQLLYTNGTLLTDERYKSLRKAGINHFLVTRHDWELMPQREAQTIKYPKDLIIANRGGALNKLEKPLNLPCYAPTEALIITVTGDVILCCNDSRRENIMGNIMQQPLEKIWLSKRFLNIRNLLKEGKRGKGLDICRNCDDKEYIEDGQGYYKDLI